MNTEWLYGFINDWVTPIFIIICLVVGTIGLIVALYNVVMLIGINIEIWLHRRKQKRL